MLVYIICGVLLLAKLMSCDLHAALAINRCYEGPQNYKTTEVHLLLSRFILRILISDSKFSPLKMSKLFGMSFQLK